MKPINTRVLPLPGFGLDELVKESSHFLQEHEPEEGYFVGFSGGKDSIVTLELCRLAGVKHQAFFSCTRIDPPELYSFIRKCYPDIKWLYPKETFWTLIKRKVPPMRMQRWCCDALKKEPAKGIPLKHRVMGIRAEESVRRASRPRIDSFYGQIMYKPIFYWPEWAVWDFIEQRKLPYPSLYDEGFGRIGCICCPFIMSKNNKRLDASMDRWPKIWKVMEKTVKMWWEMKRNTGEPWRTKDYQTADGFWKAYLRGFDR